MYKNNTPTLVTAGASLLAQATVNSSVAQEIKADNQVKSFRPSLRHSPVLGPQT